MAAAEGNGLSAGRPERCSGCRFVQLHPDDSGSRIELVVCRRYPKPETVTPNWWCGEFKQSED